MAAEDEEGDRTGSLARPYSKARLVQMAAAYELTTQEFEPQKDKTIGAWPYEHVLNSKAKK